MEDHEHVRRQRMGATWVIAFWLAFTLCIVFFFGAEAFLDSFSLKSNDGLYFLLSYTVPLITLWVVFAHFRSGGLVAGATLFVPTLMLANAVYCHLANVKDVAGWMIGLTPLVLVPGSALALLLGWRSPNKTMEPTR